MITFVALDFETTGTDCWGDVTGGEAAAPIQIGLYVPSADLRLKSEIGGWDWDKFGWDEESAAIHNIPKEVVDAAEPVWKVDVRMAAQLLDVTGSRMFNVPLGWNVSGFDRQFIIRHFPNLNRVLSYRSADLNSILFQLVDDEDGYNSLKKKAKRYANDVMKDLGIETQWHDAAYDAEASWYAFEYLRGVQGSILP